MAWIIEKNKMLEALSVLDLIPQTGIPSSEFVRITRDTRGATLWSLCGTASADARVVGKGEWPYKKPFYINRRALLPFVQAVLNTKKPFEFSKLGKTLLLRQGKRKARFSMQTEVSGYGFSKKQKAREIMLSPGAKNLIFTAHQCATEDPIVPQLNCVYVERNSKHVDIMATNQKIVFLARTSKKKSRLRKIIFPLFLVELLNKGNPDKIFYDDKYMAFQFPSTVIVQPLPRKAQNSFPIKSIVELFSDVEKYPVLFRADCANFSKVVERLSSYLVSVAKQNWVLRLSGNAAAKELILSSHLPMGSFKEYAHVKEIREDFILQWPLDMMLPIFEYIKQQRGVNFEVRKSKSASYLSVGEIKVALPERVV